MARLITSMVAALLVSSLAFAQGDTLEMGGLDDQARFEQGNKPTRGMSQARVQSVFGPPESREAAVGEPPISRWHYADFIVYFEYDKVIHAVSKR